MRPKPSSKRKPQTVSKVLTPNIARLLGHRRVKSTARYAHLDDRDVVAAVEVVGEVLEG